MGQDGDYDFAVVQTAWVSHEVMRFFRARSHTLFCHNRGTSSMIRLIQEHIVWKSSSLVSSSPPGNSS